jgi:hypothetical protein
MSRQEIALQQDKWLCNECKLGRHCCFVCGQEGVDEIDVKKCSQNRCGKYYHWKCLRGYIYTVNKVRELFIDADHML